MSETNPTDVVLDIDQPFGRIFESSTSFKTELQALSTFKRQAAELHSWSESLRFITSHPSRWRNNGSGPRPSKERCIPASTTFTGVEAGVPCYKLTQSSTEPCSCNAWSRNLLDLAERKLSITNKDDAPKCQHYVAVSYCWPVLGDSEPLEKPVYTLHSNSGEKSNDAPNQIIRRALSVAHYYELSAIWIDQECIDQHDEEDKECGIQSMDLVYEHAHVAVGILSLVVQEQIFMDFLNLDIVKSMAFDTHEKLADVLRFLRWIDTERWFTRAWCMQESWAAGPKMVLLIQHDLGLVKPMTLGTLEGEVMLGFHVFGSILSVMISNVLEGHKRVEGFAVDSEWLLSLGRRTIKPLAPDVHGPMVIGSRHRLRCSAAEGLWSLAPRQNSRIADRIAILGNLCNYTIRLDTAKLADQRCSFSAAALALAILNGDLSLVDLVPARGLPPATDNRDSTSGEEDRSGPIKPAAATEISRLGYSWGPPSNSALNDTVWIPEGVNPRRLTKSTLTPSEGLQTQGWIFRCDLGINISPVPARFKSEYEEALNKQDRTASAKLSAVIVSTTVRLLMLAGFHRLAQEIWTHENDFQLEASNKDRTERTDEDDSQPATPAKVPRDLSHLIYPKCHCFIYPNSKHGPESKQNEDRFLAHLTPSSNRPPNKAGSDRNWFVRAAMTGMLHVGYQVNAGLAIDPRDVIDVTTVAGQGTTLTYSDGTLAGDVPYQKPPDQQHQDIPPAEEIVSSTGQPKSMYTAVFEKRSRAVFSPCVAARVDPHSTLQTWRPSFWNAERVFKAAEGDRWRVLGTGMTRGYVGYRSLPSVCYLE